MKTTCLILASVLACNTVKAPEPERPKLSFAEGICAGIFIGVFAGLSIWVVYRCASNIHIPVPDTNQPPDWVIEPPPPPEPPTNNVVTNNVAKLEAGNTVWGQPLASGQMGYVIRLEGSDNLSNWTHIGTLQGAGQNWRLWSPEWRLLSSGGTNLTAPFTNTFYRTAL